MKQWTYGKYSEICGMNRIVALFFVFALLLLMPTGLHAQSFAPEKQLTKKQMIRDMRLTLKKLEKHHPNLYIYTDKTRFRNSFDSLLVSLPECMLSKDFYLIAAETFYSLRHGHMLLYPGKPQFDPLKKNVLSQMQYEIFDGQVYIIRNDSSYGNILPGTRLDSINGISVTGLVARYLDAVPMEGYAETLRPRLFCQLLPTFVMYEAEKTDSLSLSLGYSDEVFSCRLKTNSDGQDHDFRSTVQTYLDLFNPEVTSDSSGVYSSFASMKFLESSRETAMMSVNSFMQSSEIFFEEAFRMLDTSGTQNLILDLRDNLGGMLMTSGSLYGYLTDTPYYFIQKPVVTSVRNLFYPPGNVWFQNVMTTIVLPVLIGLYSPIHRAESGGYSFNAFESRKGVHKESRFTGSITLLVNGGTFSASSLLASNLKFINQALVVGEETGGAAEGTVAMRMASVKMPNSGFRLQYGIGYLQPMANGEEPGRGVIPDVWITPTLNDRIRGIDPELRYVLELLHERE
jgi:hypothetical protein